MHTVIVPTAAAAQATPDTAAVCFAGRPLPYCRTFWLTEVGYYRSAFGPQAAQPNSPPGDRQPDLNSHGSLELGLMSNRDPRTAVGGTAFIGIGGSTLRYGLKGRYRRWISERRFAEVSGGPVRISSHWPDSPLWSSGVGITGDVSLGWRDWVAVTARAEAVRGGGHTRGALYGGLRLGSYPAIVATAAVAAYIGLLLALIGGEGT